MAGSIVTTAFQVVGPMPAASMVGPNARVRGALGAVATVADLVALPDGGTGTWTPVVGRVTVSGVGIVTRSAIGTATHPGTSPTPMNVSAGDPRLEGQ